MKDLSNQEPIGLHPIKTIKYWLNAYSDPASGEHFMGHGMVVTLLREYLSLREATLPAQPPPVQEPVTSVTHKWRDLALQFDAHRMSAVAHLKAMLQDPAKHADVAREFLSAPPPAAQPAVPLTDEQINKLRQQYGVTSDGRGIKEFTYVVDFARAIEAAHGITKGQP